jgi:hypothetical protein
VSAPALGSNWQEQLRALPRGWDSYHAAPIQAEAIRTVEAIQVVPVNDGGLQVEIHRAGYDIEIMIAPKGFIAGVLVAHESAKQRGEAP